MQYPNNLKPQNMTAFPDPLAPDSEKRTDEYGIKVANAIAMEWFNGGLIDSKSSTFMGRHQWIKEMREFHRGEQDVDQYKQIMFRQSGDEEILNLDWRISNYAEKFDNIVINGISEEFYRLDVRSADKFSLLQKKKRIDEHRKNMLTKNMLEKAKALGLPDITPKGFVPEDDEELRLYSEIKERPKQEISEEIMINFVKSVSAWDHLKQQADKDLVLCDLMAARIETDPVNGVMIRDVDIEAYGHSYVEKPDFSDAYYHFEVDAITINELRKESNLPDKALREIAKTYSAANSTMPSLDYNTIDINEILNYRIHVMRFCFKSDKEIVMKAYQDKKNRLRKVAIRDSNYTVPEGSEKSRISKKLDTWYEGNFVVGAQKYIYGYKECENLERDEMDRVQCPFIVQSVNIYKNKLKSFLSNIIPMVNKLILADLKIQHLMMELKPDLTVINLNQLAEINTDTKGESKSDNWQTALSILGVKGVILEQTIDMGDEGGVQKGQSARPAPNQQGSALAPLLNIWAQEYNKIREITGINPARDGSISPDSLVGVNQLMQLASNTVTKHIVDAALRFDKRVCEAISARLKTIFSHKEAKHLQEMYQRAVGKHNIEAQESLKDRNVMEFGFTIEMIPAKEELDYLREDLNIALQEGTIDVSEKAEIMRIARTNMKQAQEYMAFIRRRRIKEKMKEVEFNQRMQTESNQQAAMAKIQGETQQYGAQKQIDLQYQGQLAMIELEKKLQELQIEAPTKEIEFKRELIKERMKVLATINMTKFKEDQKTIREKEGDTRASKMIEQRNKDLGAINFKDEFDLDSIFT